MLWNLHILPYRPSELRALSERHSTLLPVLSFIGSGLAIAAAVALWKMSKLAFRLFLIQTVVSIGAAFYLSYVSPVASEIQIQKRHSSVLVVALSLAIIPYVFRCAYAWWVTLDRHPLKESAGIVSDPGPAT